MFVDSVEFILSEFYHVLNHIVFGRRFERYFSHHQASVNGDVCGIYVTAGGSKCPLVVADWLVCFADVSGLCLDGDVLLAVEVGVADLSGLNLDDDEFWRLFFFSLFFCSIGFQMAGNLNVIPLI